MKNLSTSNKIGNLSKICGIVREQFQFLQKIIAFPQVIMTFSSLPLKATHLHSRREEVTMWISHTLDQLLFLCTVLWKRFKGFGWYLVCESKGYFLKLGWPNPGFFDDKENSKRHRSQNYCCSCEPFLCHFGSCFQLQTFLRHPYFYVEVGY